MVTLLFRSTNHLETDLLEIIKKSNSINQKN
jgi:hypothetical protein